MSKKERYLFLAPSDWSDFQVTLYMDSLVTQYGEDVEYVNLRDWYRDQFNKLGSRATFVYDTVHGRAADTREPHFDGFLVPPLVDGPAYAIARHAMAYGRKVLHENKQVRDLEPTENGNYAVII